MEEDPNTNTRKSNAENDRDETTAPADTLQDLEQLPDIFKLNIDCFEDVFDYMPMTDLIVVGKTCKRLQKVAGHCFRRTYPNISGRIGFQGNIEINLFHPETKDVTHFAEFIEKMAFYVDDIENRQTFFKIHSRLRRLKELQLDTLALTDAEIDSMKEVLGNLEVLRVTGIYSLNRNLNNVIDHCSKLKCLNIEFCDFDNDLLVRTYPTLESLTFYPSIEEAKPILLELLELNRNIRKLTTSFAFLWTNRNSLRSSINIKLDELTLRLCRYDPECQFGLFFNFLDVLQKRGFFQKLRLLINIGNGVCMEQIETQLAMVNGLVKLDLIVPDKRIALSALKNLEEVHLYHSDLIIDAENTAINLINLKRIQFHSASMDQIMPFIRRSAALQKIEINYLDACSIYFNSDTSVIDLAALNRERHHLADARKVTLYCEEEIYLATKWAMNETNLEFVRLSRIKSFDYKDI